MPCRTDPSPEEYAAERARNAAKTEANRLAKETYDPLLCSACRVLERMGYDFDENPSLSVWWDQHKRDDVERERILQNEQKRAEYRERIVLEALVKPLKDLSNEERHLLKEMGYL
jgi:hypothetical protein